MSTSRFLSANGIILPPSDTPPVSTFLQSHPGAYTTTRTHSNATSLLFWDRHFRRLAHSLQSLLLSDPNLVFGPGARMPAVMASPTLIDLERMVRRRVNGSLGRILPVGLRKRNGDAGAELAITALVGGNSEEFSRLRSWEDVEMIDKLLDVYVHIGMYVPPVFGLEGNGARLAMVKGKRDLAQAKYSDWARQRLMLEGLRPPTATELLLSDDGDKILEGSITNFFVVCLKDTVKSYKLTTNDSEFLNSFEVQTAPLHEGVLPGVVRQLVIETCIRKGITVREVAPSWSKRETWTEAFITNSLRLVQHVESIEAPRLWASQELKTWKEISWVNKQFKEGTGVVTATIQSGVMEQSALEGCSLGLLSIK